ncbi:MAG: 4Fe-4S dicluster domain-containing protein [Phycisphaerales bacterium]|nr:MAG: 4Fe-4S dicluster domain-containing protein [Phycisphaerales bacterium]
MPTTPANDSDAAVRQEVDSPPSTRREFIKCTASAVGAGVVTLVIGDLAAGAGEAGLTTTPSDVADGGYDWTRHRYVYLIDTRKCIGCGFCVRACAQENDVPPGYFRTWVERYRVSRTGETEVDSPDGGKNGFEPPVSGRDITKGFFFPKLCNQCTFTPCVQLCPVGASYRTVDGVILVDEKRCIGCGYCVQGCPYGTRFIHPEKHVASKCTLCYHRITRGLKPACVQACPVEARMIGDTRQVGDKVAEIIATERVQVLQPELLTEPNCYYLGLTREAR